MATPNDDPIRAEVERILHVVADVTVLFPLRIATAVPRCVVRRASRRGPLAEPLRVMRSLIDAATVGGSAHGLLTPDDAPAPAGAAVSGAETLADGIAGPPVDLPIEDYESLAASQVVDRLPTLTTDELRSVQTFETAHRGRRTILGRIEQLLG